MGKLIIGTSGFSYVHWRGRFYPDDLNQKQWLEYYSRSFESLELNVTFYRTPKAQTFRAWALRVPDSFVFVVKAPRFITHTQRLRVTSESLNNFSESVASLEGKLSCVLWQLPPSLKADKNLLLEFMQKLSENKMLPTIRHSFEFRNESWYVDEIYEVLKSFGACLVVSHSNRFPCIIKRTADFNYFRFHGGESLYSSCYSEQELKHWAKIIAPELEKGDVYIFFNNDMNAYAVHNALSLRQMLLK